MNTQEINGKKYTITEGEGGKLIFTPVVEEVKQRKPKAGEVWSVANGKIIILVNLGDSVTFLSGSDIFDCGEIYGPLSHDIPLREGRGIRLGKFDEVYVNRAEFISDVRKALSHEDSWGDSILNSFNKHDINVANRGTKKTREALRKLNIITD